MSRPAHPILAKGRLERSTGDSAFSRGTRPDNRSRFPTWFNRRFVFPTIFPHLVPGLF